MWAGWIEPWSHQQAQPPEKKKKKLNKGATEICFMVLKHFSTGQCWCSGASVPPPLTADHVPLTISKVPHTVSILWAASKTQQVPNRCMIYLTCNEDLINECGKDKTGNGHEWTPCKYRWNPDGIFFTIEQQLQLFRRKEALHKLVKHIRQPHLPTQSWCPHRK